MEGDFRLPYQTQGVDVKVTIEDQACGNNTSSCKVTDDEKAQVEAAIAAGQAAAQADFKEEAEKLSKKVEELNKKIAELEKSAAEEVESEEASANERLVRLQADWENYRRRTAKERISERERACEGLVKNLLPVIDDMERAIAHAESDTDQSEGLVHFTDGVKAVKAKMLDVLAKEKVELIDAKGEAFDPLCHKAVGRVEDKDMYDESVHDVYQNGYRMAGKVIREAMVCVSFGGPKRPQEETEEQPSDSDTGVDENTQVKDSE